MISPQISIGPLTLHLYGAIIAIAIYFGWRLARRRAHLYQIPQKIFDDPILVIPLILGVAGARIYHVLHLRSYYVAHPGQIIAITNGGLGIWGALAGIFIGIWIFAKIKRINFLSLLDLTAPSILLGQAIGRIGNYINQEGFGQATNLPWGIEIAPENRPIQILTSTHFHPTFFYEAILDLVFFAILFYLQGKYSSSESKTSREVILKTNNNLSGKFSTSSNNKNFRLYRGQIFALYLIFYAAGRFITEFWRIDTWTVGTIKIAHLLSLIVFAIGLWFFLRPYKPLTPLLRG